MLPALAGQSELQLFFGTDRMACMAGTSSCATSTAHTGFWHLLLVQTIMCTSCSLKS